jgi:hypothetical protein
MARRRHLIVEAALLHLGSSMCFARVSHYQLPKGVVHHQVEDGERALLTVDAGVIAQQLGEGPDPLAGVARANELVADGIPGMYVRCSGATPSLNVAAGPPSSSPSA